MTSGLRGKGGSENLPILQMISTDRVREMQMKGEGGSKGHKILQTSYVHAPLHVSQEVDQQKSQVPSETKRTAGCTVFPRVPS